MKDRISFEPFPSPNNSSNSRFFFSLEICLEEQLIHIFYYMSVNKYLFWFQWIFLHITFWTDETKIENIEIWQLIMWRRNINTLLSKINVVSAFYIFVSSIFFKNTKTSLFKSLTKYTVFSIERGWKTCIIHVGREITKNITFNI